jgi:hypothetical protein
MPPENDSLVARVQSSYRKLSDVAIELNSVSDTLGKMIADLDATLKKLNLGLTVWVQIRGSDDQQTHNHWSEELGYAKINGKWGIALRTVEGNYNYPDQDSIETWLFNDAPRQIRLSSIAYIPELLEKLSEQIVEKLETTLELVNAIKEAADEPKALLPPRMRTRPTVGEKK